MTNSMLTLPPELAGAANAGSIVIAALELARDTLATAPEFAGRVAIVRVIDAALAYGRNAPRRRPATIEIDGKQYLWRDIAALRRQQLAEPLPRADQHSAHAGTAATEPPTLGRWHVTWRQVSYRTSLVDAWDGEEAIARVNQDLFTPRDQSELTACHLGSWTAQRRSD